MLYKYIGEQIRSRRQKMHLTQEKLSKACDISLSFLGHIERGTRKLSVETLLRLSRALECSTDELLGTEMQNTGSSPQDFLLHVINMLDQHETNP